MVLATTYEDIYSRVLPKFTNYNILNMEDSEVRDMLQDYLMIAIPKFHVCRKDLYDKDDYAETFNVELSEMEMDILTNYMCIAYIDAEYINTPLMLKSALNSRDFNTFSPANHLDKLLLTHKTLLMDNEALLMRYAWGNEGYKDITVFGKKR